MSAPVLALDNIEKSFGALRVTQGVSLDVRPGEVHALIGPNGAGKTTLVAQIAGALRPDSGRIRFRDRDVTGLGVAARARLGLGRVFQLSNVVGTFTALENVAVAIVAAGDRPFGPWQPALRDPALGDEAAAALARVGLADRAETRASDLSHGERRALELAMSLVQDPKLLLLDEPMAGTGRAEGERLTELLLSLKGRVPMLLVEHDMGTVFRLADRITVLIYGSVAVTGAPDAVRADPVVRKAYLGEEEAV
ncbi:ABC transporter ATP-binding protein [Rhodoplanes sp. TEM]|uniref:ABC transporter ATP-binding protein n=1 Tax=Rhodoplanes tepidamans TaxID=200616 RepID=A0ABT5J502_RHOTP|nr:MULTISPECIES: ABC transporter ATP-binding protein [Rhodoplanes]MDC7784712.1 ABC transporter ATP-binding protein [Rhodoplanes tepidamans]MDC7982179.1 ABC transporter ATP-binding protein [Rhodoplanes sp. TEM]MDQ0356183.1 branched-chain amino acid transport system ATP-binding protein [Rhodoplanes tepidamans]